MRYIVEPGACSAARLWWSRNNVVGRERASERLSASPRHGFLHFRRLVPIFKGVMFAKGGQTARDNRESRNTRGVYFGRATTALRTLVRARDRMYVRVG